MKSPRSQRLPSAALAALLDNELSADARLALERQLGTSEAQRSELESWTRLRAQLLEPPPSVDGIDLVEAVHRSIGARPAVVPRRPLVWQFGLAGAASLATALGLGQGWSGPEEPQRAAADAREFQPKSSADDEARRWVGVHVYHVQHGSEPVRIGAEIQANVPLLFSYVNQSAPELAYLMIFAVDSSGKSVWFHPARPDSDSDPTSLAVVHSATEIPIPELVRQRLSPGRLDFHALFSREPLRARDVQAWLDAHPGEPYPLAPGAGIVQVVSARVVP